MQPSPGVAEPSASMDSRAEVRRARWLGVAALLPVMLVLALFGWRLAARDAAVNGPGINSVGQLAPIREQAVPMAALQSFDGTHLSLADLRGSPVVVNFWGSWCVPCRQEAAALERTWQLTRDRGVRFVGVNVWEPESDARQFIQELGITYTNVTDPEGRLAVELGLTGIPETFFITPEGRVVQRWIGPINEQQLANLIDVVGNAPASPGAAEPGEPALAVAAPS